MNKWLKGANAAVLSAAVLGIFYYRDDLPVFRQRASVGSDQEQKKFTLSDQTATTLKALNQDVHIIAFDGGDANPLMTRQVLDMVQEYKKRSGKKSLLTNTIL